jgi:hypothetical protein
MIESLATKLLDLQSEHAALQKKSENLQQDQIKSKKIHKALSEKLSTAEQAAKNGETELTEKLSTAEQVAKERETELTEKIHTAEHAAKERETELVENLAVLETILEQSQQSTLQREERSRVTTAKCKAHIKHIAAQVFMILLLQTELLSQQFKLKEKKTQPRLRHDRDESAISKTPEFSIEEANIKREEAEPSSQRFDARDAEDTYIRQLR